MPDNNEVQNENIPSVEKNIHENTENLEMVSSTSEEILLNDILVQSEVTNTLLTIIAIFLVVKLILGRSRI